MKKKVISKIFVCSLTALMLTGSLGSMQTHAADMGKYADGGFVKSHWSYKDVNYAIDNGWIDGKLDTKTGKVNLDVNGITTRAEFLKMLFNIVDPGLVVYKGEVERIKAEPGNEGWVEVRNGSLPDWYKEYANAYQTLTGNLGENTAEYWGKPINRNEMAVFTERLVRELKPTMLDATKPNIKNSITDRNSKDYNSLVAWDAIEKLYSNGIVTGKANNEYKPYDNGTRGEVATVLRRLADRNARVEVVIKENQATDRYDYTEGENTTLRQDDPNRRAAKDGDTFIDLNGKAWTVKFDAKTQMLNPIDPVGFDLGRVNSLGETYGVGSVSDGTGGGQFGDVLVQSPIGRIAWTSEFEKLYESGFDKPTTTGKKDGELSPYKYWVWSDLFGEWTQNRGFMNSRR